MSEMTPPQPPWPRETPRAPWDELPEFDTLGDLLRAAPLPPPPPADHLARLNRMALARATATPRWRQWLSGLRDAIAAAWYSPMGHRFAFAGGATAVLLLGLWIGLRMNRIPAADPDWVSISAPSLAGSAVETPRLSAGRSGSLAMADEEFGVESPLRGWPVERADVRPASGAPRLSEQGRTIPTTPNPFPSVYVMPREEETEWLLFSDFSATPSRPATARSLTEPLASARPAESAALAAAAREIVDDDLLGALRRLKLDLYVSGGTEEIPRLQRIEEILSQLLTSQLGVVPEGGELDLETQRRFAEAERHLLNRDFRRAEDTFNDIAHEHSDSPLAALCWYHLGDIYYDFHGDFAGARQCYTRALADAEEAAQIFPAETMARLEHRLALLEDASARGSYEPLRLLRQAEAAPAGASLDHYRRLLLEHASSEAVADGINSLAERAMLEIAEEPNFPHDAISILRQCQSVPGAAQRTLAQLRLADIIYNRLRDYPQALIEYGQIRMDDAPPEMEAMIRDRIAQILDNRISQAPR